MTGITLIFEIGSILYYLSIFTTYFDAFLDKRITQNKVIWSISIAFIFLVKAVLPYIFNNSGQIAIITSITTIAMAFMYKSSLMSKILSSVLLIVLLMASDVAANFIFWILGQPSASIENFDIYLYAGQSIAMLILFFMVKVASALKVRNSKWILSNNFFLVLVPIISIAVIYATELVTYSSFSTTLIIISSLGIIYINIIVFHIFDNMIKKLENVQKSEFLKRQIEYQSASYEKSYLSFLNIRTITNDTQQQLKYIRQLLSEKKFDETENYINKTLNIISNSYQRLQSGNAVIDALVSNTLDLCHSQNIRTNIQIGSIPTATEISKIDLCVLLGCILDNATDACKKIDACDDKFLNIKISCNDMILIIDVENSCHETPRRLPSGIFQTTKPDPINHGFGLLNVENIVRKYKGRLTIDTYENVFHLNCSIIL